LVITRLLYQKDIYELAAREDNFLLKYYSDKYFKTTYLLVLVFLLILIFGPFKGANPITIFCLSIINWFLNIRVIGALIPWIAGILLIGTFNIALSFAITLVFGRKSNA